LIIKPIPKCVLTHTVVYEEFQKGDGINTEERYKPSVELLNVRVQYLSEMKNSTSAEEQLYDALLLFDVVNSKAAGDFEFIEKSKVVYNGKTMFVKKVNPVEAFKLHHWEIGLK
jgi:Minor capsid protein